MMCLFLAAFTFFMLQFGESYVHDLHNQHVLQTDRSVLLYAVSACIAVMLMQSPPPGREGGTVTAPGGQGGAVATPGGEGGTVAAPEGGVTVSTPGGGVEQSLPSEGTVAILRGQGGTVTVPRGGRGVTVNTP